MSNLRFQAAPFFASKNRAFWNLQLAGWGGAFLLRALTTVANGLPYNLLVPIFVTYITGFSISLVLSVVYRQLIGRSPIVTWGGTAIVLFLAVVLHASIEAWVQALYQGAASETSFIKRLLGLSFIPLALLGGWSALYYAINFFLTVEKQADRLERLEAQATSAQLAMLRYQLNPHFLFNTLNSISTLVLLKQTDQANAMLTRLSAFLRHTLVTEPGSQVTLAQEIETLQLYLDIERMRFEERLRTVFEIEDAALDACLPSMLLQPLIENAVKYAVSPQEEGAQIALTARVVGQRLRITVEDTGPGIDGPVQHSLFNAVPEGALKPVSTGVGLANIRNRLMQGYGEDHLFEAASQPGGGFRVMIEIPYEPREETAALPGTSQTSVARAPSTPAPAPAAPAPAAAAAPAPASSGEPDPPDRVPQTARTSITLNPRNAIGNT